MTDEESAARGRETLARIRTLYRHVLDSNQLEHNVSCPDSDGGSADWAQEHDQEARGTN